jgi:hypothetical protein
MQHSRAGLGEHPYGTHAGGRLILTRFAARPADPDESNKIACSATALTAVANLTLTCELGMSRVRS